MKKILYSILFIFAFILIIFKGDYINVLAYQELDSTLGIYPAKLDIDNYQRYNLFDNLSYKVEENSANIVEMDVSTINIKCNISDCYVGDIFNINSQYYINVVPNTYYKFSYNDNNVGSNSYIGFFDSNNNYLTLKQVGSNDSFVTPDNCYKIVIRLGVQNGVINQVYDFTHIQITEGQQQLPFAPFFRFGSLVTYKFSLYNPTSNNITTDVIIKNNNEIKVIRTITVNANSYLDLFGGVVNNSSGTIDYRFYLPYTINNDNSISINYNLSVEFSNNNIVLKSNENINNDSYFYFEPVFQGYYKNIWTNNLYFENNYIFNSISYIGFNANGNGLNNISFNCFGDISQNYCLQDSIYINPNSSSNIVANNLFDNKYSNIINFNDVFIYGNSRLFSFSLNIGNQNESISSGANYNVNLSYFALNIINDSSVSAPLPNNINTINKYNSCSAWYDIPCQLGNAVTYVIYEAPIISPVLTFVVSFITMFSSLVSFVDLFSSFGIVFGCFIIYMFIELLHKYSK